MRLAHWHANSICSQFLSDSKGSLSDHPARTYFRETRFVFAVACSTDFSRSSAYSLPAMYTQIAKADTKRPSFEIDFNLGPNDSAQMPHVHQSVW